MHPNAALIERLYAALARGDPEGMSACYDAESTFRDPVFGKLDRDATTAMWRMLLARDSDLDVDLKETAADDTTGRALLIAEYTFPATGRRVRNVIRARFRFRDGRIVRHEDRFDLWRWTAMALGARGRLLGWTPLVRVPLRRGARRALERHRARERAEKDGPARI